ncbi:MAG: DUF5320 domain-containing protein [Streptomycetaceae bacterium]|nr:DUF5320 domain-containing protein [Streptomycetaceae bacterium]
MVTTTTDSGIESTITQLREEVPRLEARKELLEKELTAVNERLAP